ncbi:hypothetical protein MMC13_006875 [Lambiella insularis]|nr:hypothetical protein [Lambiella insularis]
MQEKIIELLQTTFFARYGDTFAEACKVLKTTAEGQKINGWQMLSKAYCTDIGTRLKEEESAYKKFLKTSEGHEDIPLHILISQACNTVGFCSEDMREIVKLYATRNELMHANLLILIKQGKPVDLAKRLHDDFCDLPNIVPASLWFEKRGDQDNIQRWAPTQRLEDLMNEFAKVGPAEEAEKWRTASEDITKALK